MKMTKKKGKSSILLQICVLITLITVLSALTILWLAARSEAGISEQHVIAPSVVGTVVGGVSEKVATREELVATLSPTQSGTTVPVTINRKAVVLSKHIHFIHIPKCGGTTMTTLLRQMQCITDPVKNADCCLNPGFCDWHAHRRCATIQGCINHFPNRKLIYKPMPSIAIVREPISRGHSPNLDFFQVRPEFKDIKDGKRPKVVFAEYLEMPEYQNIQTRMLGADSFPYRNITITEQIFAKAVDALAHIFFVGLQEEFAVSSEALIREMGMSKLLPAPDIKKERDQSNARLARDKAEIKGNATLLHRAREVNEYDIRLYKLAVDKFCETLRNHPDLLERVESNRKVNCGD